MRLDQALAADLRTALRSWPIRGYLLLQLVAAVVFVARRGSDMLVTVGLIWLGLAVLGFTAWWAGRHRLARPTPDVVPAARAKAVFALVGAAGLMMWGFDGGAQIAFVLLTVGVGGWAWSAWRSTGGTSLREKLVRDPRPFLPMMMLIGLPKLLALGPVYLLALLMALPSGVGQQLLLLLGLFGPLEAATRRPAVAAVVAALAFAAVHVPMILDENQGDLLAATANAILFQASVGLIAVLAYTRHRAAVPIGVAHAMAIA